MPRDNFGFKGTALTPAQAYEAGASVSSQEYNYAVSLGVITPASDGPVFNSVSSFSNSDAAPYSSFSISGQGTSSLSVLNSVVRPNYQAPNVGGQHWVQFTLASESILEIDGLQFDGSYPVVSGILYPCLTSDTAVAGWSFDKDGVYRYGLPTRYMSLVAPYPIRLRMAAGTYKLRWDYVQNGSLSKTCSFNATLTAVGSYTKTFTDTNGSQQGYQGLYTDKVVIYALGGQYKYVRYTPNSTYTTLTYTLAAGDSATLSVNHYSLVSGGTPYLVGGGWNYDDKNSSHSRTITGITTVTIPSMNSASGVVGISGSTNQPITITIVS